MVAPDGPFTMAPGRRSLLGEAMRRINNEASVSSLFD